MAAPRVAMPVAQPVQKARPAPAASPVAAAAAAPGASPASPVATEPDQLDAKMSALRGTGYSDSALTGAASSGACDWVLSEGSETVLCALNAPFSRINLYLEFSTCR
jgi:hypothetical protein